MRSVAGQAEVGDGIKEEKISCPPLYSPSMPTPQGHSITQRLGGDTRPTQNPASWGESLCPRNRTYLRGRSVRRYPQGGVVSARGCRIAVAPWTVSCFLRGFDTANDVCRSSVLFSWESETNITRGRCKKLCALVDKTEKSETIIFEMPAASTKIFVTSSVDRSGE